MSRIVARRRSTEFSDTDQIQLREELKEWAPNGINLLGEYESLTRTQAASGPGLAACHKLVAMMIRVRPDLHFGMVELRDAISSALLESANSQSLNTTQFKNTVWCTFKAERLLTIAAHFRRIGNPHDETRFRQASAKCNGHELKTLPAGTKVIVDCWFRTPRPGLKPTQVD